MHSSRFIARGRSSSRRAAPGLSAGHLIDQRHCTLHTHLCLLHLGAPDVNFGAITLDAKHCRRRLMFVVVPFATTILMLAPSSAVHHPSHHHPTHGRSAVRLL